jgi:hypothetical protein
MAKVIGIDGSIIQEDSTKKEGESPYLLEYKRLVREHNRILQGIKVTPKDELYNETIEIAEIKMANLLYEANKNLLDFFVIEMTKVKRDLDNSHTNRSIDDGNRFDLAYLRLLTLYSALTAALPQFNMSKDGEVRKYDKMVEVSRKNLMKLVKNEEDK